jgi:ubiquinone/menaquinone biosynthesis C-methylase UbiE
MLTVIGATLVALLLAPDAGVPPAAAEPSVRPGANQQYLDKELSVWQERFEGGGREIFAQREALLRASGVKPGMTVADVGAGTGLFTFPFASAVGPRGRVYAVDIIPRFIDHLKSEAATRNLKNVVPILGQARALPLPEASVDVMFLCDAYHHFEYPRSMNRSMYRALRPGGTLLLIDFHRRPGKTPKAVLEHVRAGQEVFTRELLDAGFEQVEELPLLTESYVVRFRKPARERR